MIQFHEVTLKNFLSVGSKPVTISLDSNRVTVITGSNGSGKTTIYDAVFYALYGKAFRKINVANIINSYNKKEMLVSVKFSTNGHEYIVERGQKPNIFTIQEDGIPIKAVSSIKEQQEYLIKHILKAEEKTFKQLILVGSNYYVPFMYLSAMDRRQVVENTLGLDIFSKMNVRAKQMLSECNTYISNLESEIKIVDAKLNTLLHRDNTALEAIRANYDSIIESLEAKKQALIESEMSESTRIPEYKDAISQADIMLKDIAEKMKSTNEDIAFARGKMNTVSKQLESLENQSVCPLCQQSIDQEYAEKIHKQYKDLEDVIEYNITSGISVSEDLKKRSEEVKKYQSVCKKKVDRFTSSVLELKKIQDELTKKKSERDRAIEDLTRQLSENTEAEVQGLTSERDTAVKKLEELEERRTYYLECLEMLKDTGIKKIFIQKIVPTINGIIKKYLDKVEFNASFVFDEEFNETIKSRNRVEYQYNNFSGGEKTKIDYCLLFAFRELSMRMSCVSTNLLLIDEGDLTLDSNGIYNIMNIISYNDTCQNVFIISQRPDDYMNYCQRVIDVTKTEHFSQFKETIR